jgi:hypothetical protein
MHLPDPGDVVATVVKLLRPGGVLVCEDADVVALFCEPPAPAFDRMVALFQRLSDGRTSNGRAPFCLPDAFRRAGLVDVEWTLYRHIATSAGEKAIMPLTLAMTADAIVADGIATRAEVDEIVFRLNDLSDDPAYAFAMPRMHQISGRINS